jgi:hypothetical protein
VTAEDRADGADERGLTGMTQKPSFSRHPADSKQVEVVGEPSASQ